MCNHYHRASNTSTWTDNLTAAFDALQIASRCDVCQSSMARLHVCVECQQVLCMKHGHLQQHMQESGHTFGVDATSRELYCNECKDYIFPVPSLQHQVRDLKRKATHQGNESPKKRTRIGLRGLHNLGSTCFMSCILQAMCHIPPLNKQLLSNQMVSGSCSEGCLGCAVQALIKDLHTDENEAVNPHRLLWSLWRSADHLAGYDQQDAHEFFMASLDSVQTHCANIEKAKETEGKKENEESANKSNESSCLEVVDNMFGGEMSSVVECQNCGHRSTTVDPFLDIALHLKTHTRPSRKLHSLGECLSRFTQSEPLQGASYTCNSCKKSSKATKQLLFRKLPTVACFHLKRFEGPSHKIKARTTKIDNYVAFPLDINMRPYMESQSNHRSVDYSLYAVVEHRGTLDIGHYVCYVKHEGEWFLCDDANVHKVDVAEVLSAFAYLLFYVRQDNIK